MVTYHKSSVFIMVDLNHCLLKFLSRNMLCVVVLQFGIINYITSIRVLANYKLDSDLIFHF